MSTEFLPPAQRHPRYHIIGSPIGELLLVGDDDGLRGLAMQPVQPDPESEHDPSAFRETERQLLAYFAGELSDFDLPLAPRGTPFQLRVWSALRTVPYGQTTTYGELAARIDRPDAPRAVGAANGRNPIAVIVPCHRVIGSNGSLTGYGGGLERKEWLLRHEKRGAAAQPA